jgi:hypothetical protein
MEGGKWWKAGEGKKKKVGRFGRERKKKFALFGVRRTETAHIRLFL